MQNEESRVWTIHSSYMLSRILSILIYFFFVLLIVICTYKVTIDIQTVYVEEETLWKTNQWWWNKCNEADFAQNIAIYSSKCNNTHYQAHCDVLWRAIRTVAVKYWELLLYTFKWANQIHMFDLPQSTIILGTTFVLMVGLIIVARSSRCRQAPIIRSRQVNNAQWIGLRHQEMSTSEPSYFQAPSYMDRTLLCRKRLAPTTRIV